MSSVAGISYMEGWGGQYFPQPLQYCHCLVIGVTRWAIEALQMETMLASNTS